MPCANDVHQDHQVISTEAVRAFKEVTLLGYEIPWNQLESNANAFIVIEEKHLEQKWSSLAQYKSQLKLQRPYFSREYIRSLAKVRGLQINADWAEAFQVLRMRI